MLRRLGALAMNSDAPTGGARGEESAAPRIANDDVTTAIAKGLSAAEVVPFAATLARASDAIRIGSFGWRFFYGHFEVERCLQGRSGP